MLRVQYSILQFGYWVDYLIIFSFSTLVMQERGFDPSDIGFVTTIGAVSAIVLQGFIASAADRSKSLSIKTILLALLGGSLAAALCMLAMPRRYLATFVGMFTAMCLTNIVNPFLTTLCLQYNGEGNRFDYGVSRSIGSLGYSLFGFLMGQVTDRFGAGIVVPVFCVIVSLLILLVINMPGPVRKPAESEDTVQHAGGILSVFRRYPRYGLLVAGAVFLFFMQTLTNTYLIYFIREFGGDESDMGLVLSLIAFSEIPAVAFSAVFLRKFGPESLLRIAAAAGCIKFTMLIGIRSVQPFILIHLMHFFYSGMYMVSSVVFADRIVGHDDAIKAQSVLAVGVAGITGVSANLIGGYMIEHFPIRMVIFLGAVFTLIGACCIFAATMKRKDFGETEHLSASGCSVN